ncbi:MAG: hypothetical protein JXA33_12250 [Anaerolineae bacterium]|nr:hypothetical protein [Anaerolineae bacterium]
MTTMKRHRILLVVGFVVLIMTGGIFQFLSTPPSSPTSTPQPTPTSWPIPYRFKSLDYGVNIHMWWDPWASIARDWKLIEDAGFTWAKQRLVWLDIEEAGEGHYAWDSADRIVQEAGQANVNLIFRVDTPPVWALLTSESTPTVSSNVLINLEALEHFCYVLAARYQGQVRGYQVWNEPNLAREWEDQVPDPAGYVALLRACYTGIKTADPEALVISAGLAPTGSGPPDAMPDTDYLVGMYEAGAAPYFDLLGLNAPGYKAPPEISPDEAADPANDYGGQRFFCFRHVEEMRAIMARYGDAHKQVAILEFGWHTNTSPAHPDYAWFGVTPEQQGDYLVRAFHYAREYWSPWIGPMFVWNIPDSHWTEADEQFWWGIVDPFWWGSGDQVGSWGGAGIRPAYTAIAAMEKP